MEAAWEHILPQARSEFFGLSETEVWLTLAKEEDDALAVEIARLAVEFFLRYKAYMHEKELLRLPPQIMHVCVRCPVERVAVLLMVEYVAELQKVSASFISLQ